MAGNISNSNVWDPADPASRAEVRGMFEEMVGWAVEEGADLIVGETFYYAGEALSALEVAKASGLPVVLTLAPMRSEEHTSELQSRGHLVCRLLLVEKRRIYPS